MVARQIPFFTVQMWAARRIGPVRWVKGLIIDHDEQQLDHLQHYRLHMDGSSGLLSHVMDDEACLGEIGYIM